MRIGINASFLRKTDTGMGQVSRGFISELVKSYSDKNEYFLYLEKDIDFKLPKNFHKRIFLPAWKRDDLIRKIWWEKFLLPKYVKRDQCDMFISLYQCPTFLPKNIRHKMLVHDLIPKIFPDYLDNSRKKFYFFLTQKAIQHADEVITVSEWSKKDIHKFLNIPLGKIKTAYPSIGEEFF
ncbi:MAG TPA: glycosyltransferase, partial [Candidatus Saccharimonadales bacterium]|nr:glycosyltransferase [Candidatus Saccharimonadales bacterium]